jgi:RNA recognition motif-containing protein
VDLATTAEAERAINDLSGKDILERKVSVQLARKPEPAGAKEGAVSGGEASGSGEEGARRRGSGRGRGRGRGGRTARGGRTTRGPREAGEEASAAAAVEAPAVTTPAPAATTTTTTTTGEEAKSPAVPKERRQRGPPEDGIPSKIKVMVANLPYDLSEDKLKELFAAYQPTAAKIALRPIPRFMVRKLQARNEPRKGRGFGFVTLPSEDLQQKAVNEMNGKEVEGREIAVKVAIDSPGREEEAANEEAAVENGVHPEPIAA